MSPDCSWNHWLETTTLSQADTGIWVHTAAENTDLRPLPCHRLIQGFEPRLQLKPQTWDYYPATFWYRDLSPDCSWNHRLETTTLPHSDTGIWAQTTAETPDLRPLPCHRLIQGFEPRLQLSPQTWDYHPATCWYRDLSPDCSWNHRLETTTLPHSDTGIWAQTTAETADLRPLPCHKLIQGFEPRLQLKPQTWDYYPATGWYRDSSPDCSWNHRLETTTLPQADTRIWAQTAAETTDLKPLPCHRLIQGFEPRLQLKPQTWEHYPATGWYRDLSPDCSWNHRLETTTLPHADTGIWAQTAALTSNALSRPLKTEEFKYIYICNPHTRIQAVWLSTSLITLITLIFPICLRFWLLNEFGNCWNRKEGNCWCLVGILHLENTAFKYC